jgi:hypothetical protein
MKSACLFVFVCVAALVWPCAAIADCAALRTVKIADTEITLAERIASHAFSPPDYPAAQAALFHELPAFCRVSGVIRPTADSAIRFELWLPDQWNGRYLQAGNVGFAGSINYDELFPGLRNGFAVASTDDGHTGGGAAWALDHPEKVIDFGYRAVHLTDEATKLLLQTYYPKPVSHAYFHGCSDGGREGLMEAQRYPGDFDGFLVGAPANNFTGVMTDFLILSHVAESLKDPLTSVQLEAMGKYALARCDGTDDGFIREPSRCQFDPAELQCKQAPDGKCLSEGQINAIRRIYHGSAVGSSASGPESGFQLARGTEKDQWPLLIGPVPAGSGLPKPLSQIFSANFWPFMVYGDPHLDVAKLDMVRAAEEGRSRIGMIVNAMDPDLTALRITGKKIIQYHGWADAAISGEYSIRYYEAVEKYLEHDNRDFYRLFMVPGMEHCGHGPGLNVIGTPNDPLHAFDREHHVLAALVHWVEDGQAPDRIIATKYRDDDASKAVMRTRPVCAYPNVAQWTRHGSVDEAASYLCVAPTK